MIYLQGGLIHTAGTICFDIRYTGQEEKYMAGGRKAKAVDGQICTFNFCTDASNYVVQAWVEGLGL